jgi:hypothetical protein
MTNAEVLSHPWQQLASESDEAYRRFTHFVEQGQRRSRAATARAFNVAAPTLHEQAKRFRWSERAAAFDQSRVSSAMTPRLEAAAESAPLVALNDEAREFEEQLSDHLESYRADVEALGERQVKTARGLAAAAGRGLAELIQSGKMMSARDVCALATASASLGAAGAHHWGAALGLGRLQQTMAGIVEAERQALENVADVEVID